AQARNALRVRFELLLHTRRDVELLRNEQIGDGLRRGRVHERRFPELAREKKIVRAALADDDANAVAIDVLVAANRRPLGDEVRALDDDTGRAVADVHRARRIDRQVRDVPRAGLETFDALSRRGVRSDREPNAPPRRALAPA